ncbi:hypothetical protein QU487_09105 [Crenobacter sp. SG2305]|uniref:hypothetical protein n=1 Tax=Crenobacter oryzisoli TaxID=3056844 RepID=UPI0025AA5118|nr:hypothetical protein [Crenobacter sp. SG2305]MDN0082912.1 hypothetical protein [Crenobacter sp. SG2305]
MNTLNDNLASLLASKSTKNVASIDQAEIPLLLSQLLGSQELVVLSLTYPDVDDRNHKSLLTLVQQLASHGMKDSATYVDAQSPYLLFNDLRKALVVYHEIQKDSVAIGVSLYYAGLTGAAAEQAIKQHLPHEPAHPGWTSQPTAR